jgi:NAD(P)H dehydrogenase (quinone)
MTYDYTISVVYTSGFGHTARLAEAVHAGAASADGATAHLLNAETLTEDDWTTLDDSDAMIWGSPTYMGDVSASFRTFAEATSPRWMEARWRDKLAAGFTNSSCKSGDKLHALASLSLLAAQHGMLWVSLGLAPGWNHSGGTDSDLNRLGVWLGAAAQSNADEGPELVHPADLATAHHLGRRVASVCEMKAASDEALRHRGTTVS